MEQKIYEILKERFGIEDTINSDTDLVNQLGFESISLVELASVLSKETGVKVTHSQAIKWTTVTQFGVLCTDQAVKDSKIDLSKIDKNRVGVNIANAVAGTKFMDEEFSVLTNNGKEVVNPEDISPYAYARSMPNTTSNEVSYRYGFNGTCCTMATGCTRKSVSSAQT